jgi:hypothetical protein
MNNKIHLFFNHPCEMPPEGDLWNNWKDPDTTKLAWVCAESWRRAGWQVERMSSERKRGQRQFAPFTGRLAKSIEFYPLVYWNFWYRAYELCKEGQIRGQHGQWFTTIDVINFDGFSPVEADGELIKLFATKGVCPETNIVTLQSQHFSASALYLTALGCIEAVQLIEAYDRHELPLIEVDLVSDETIIRHHGKYSNLKKAAYPVEADAGWYPLIHVTKSCLTRLFEPL